MRYAIQIMVMLSDVAVFLMCGYFIHVMGWNNMMAWIIIALVFAAFNKAGAFEAWKPSVIKSFLKNAKDLGL